MLRDRPSFPVKRLPDGRALVNLGSSARVAPGWNNIDFSWLVRIGRQRWLCRWLHRVGLLSTARWERIQKLDPDMVLWDLSKGIPYPNQTFDCVYHSHVLEHIDREAAPTFLRDCYRVLKPGGIFRIVVPDLEQLTRNYLQVLDDLPHAAESAQHEFATEELFDQMVRRHPKVREGQNLVNRVVEGLLIGDTARSGTMHRWMYDRFSLERLLTATGFVDIRQQSAATSEVDGWDDFHLDTEPDGSSYKHSSLYLEARRPLAASSMPGSGTKSVPRLRIAG